MGMKYSDLVNYDKLDPFKEECIARFRKTLEYSKRLGISIVEESIGETAVAIDMGGDFYLVFNVEGLGTKNKIAESMAEKIKIARTLGFNPNFSIRKLFSGIGQDEMAMSINDLTGIGAIPFLFEPIVATGSSDFLMDIEMRQGIIDGFEIGARNARVPIPGGETPTLEGVVYPNTIDYAGASLGIIRPKSRLCVGNNLRPGLTIYGIASSGIHSNGVSLAREIAEKSPQGYFTMLSDGRTIGEALLTPTKMYSSLVDALTMEGADIAYMQPITGHGFGKIMRKKKDLTYVIDNLPEPNVEFKFLQEYGPVDNEEAYKVWNMNIGFVLYASSSESEKIARAVGKSGNIAYIIGHTEEGERSVVIPQIDVTYRPRKAA